MVTTKVYGLWKKSQTVTSELAQDPSQTPETIFKKLYEHHEAPHLKEHGAHGLSKEEIEEFEKKDAVQKALACGHWGSAEPSELFLQIYHDVLGSLDKDPSTGVVSPPLIGSRGVVPLSIVAPLPDLCRHLGNCIARAEHEVFLGTNFWIHSDAATLVTNGIRELNRRAGERGTKVVMKMVYDRGDPKQVLENRLEVSGEQRTSDKVRLPAPHEIPNVDLKVINFHRPVFGTFHSKFTVIDRRMCLLQSSNIQDNDNLEMLSHIEGPIVDAFYDAALLSYGRPLDPPLPMLNSPAERAYFLFPHWDVDFEGEAKRVNHSINPREGETPTQAVTRHLNTTIQPDTTGNAPDTDQDPRMTPYILLPQHEPFPMAVVNREPYGSPNHSSTHNPQDAAFVSAINNAKRTIFIQTPNMNADPLLEPLLAAIRRGVIVKPYLCLGYNDAGELLPFQNGTNEMIANKLYNSLKTAEEKSRFRVHYYVGKDQIQPIHNSFKKRSCHIKLMIIDEQVAIQGNGNLDTQSFFHSQEINVMLDSPLVCKAWLEVIDRNQNTAKYGAASFEDGCWHDPTTGEIPPGSIGTDPGHFSWAKGVIGAVKRVRGVGGF
ncbi:hypothetical protein N7494_005949 [Penicillium frequentans]|uniref:PLD phosphodiesterase domain-containing protein n=1 Tax=Penicillium frequentans TaxID=3151616 RepID=A0AAD6GFJ3_9EURO|nr:hypothetical protein N7494_005949 [Penicillium glabrum]